MDMYFYSNRCFLQYKTFISRPDRVVGLSCRAHSRVMPWSGKPIAVGCALLACATVWWKIKKQLKRTNDKMLMISQRLSHRGPTSQPTR